MKFQLVFRKFQLVCTPITERCDWSVQTHWSEGTHVWWKLIKFDHLPTETPHDIYTVPKEERKALLAANNELVEQRLLFEEENNDLRFFLGMMRIWSR